MSPQHAIFTLDQGGLYVKDLESKFGTFIEIENSTVPLNGVTRIQAHGVVYEFTANSG